METKDIKQFYDRSLQKSDNKYEFDRWQKTSQGRASYIATKYALLRYALPLVKNSDAVLEVGPGPGTWTKFLLEKTDGSAYDVVDISEQMLKQAKENIGTDVRLTFIHSDILDFVPTKQYDFFFSSRFIEYVPEKDRVIEIISDSLKPGGLGYIVTKTPQYNRFFSKKVKSPVHQGQISANELSDIFVQKGFSVLAVRNVTSVFPGMRVGFLDRILTFASRHMPFSLAKTFSESYAIIFRKNDI